MKCFTTEQLRFLDEQTIKAEGITSIDLMDRAALALYHRIVELIPKRETILVLAGPGNNGGDGLAVSRLLSLDGHQVTTVLCLYGKTMSNDATEQLNRLKACKEASLFTVDSSEKLSVLPACDWYIDALFGSGLNRRLTDEFASTIAWLNQQKGQVIAIDIPSGLFGEDNRLQTSGAMVKANRTLSLQFPKLACFLSENEPYTGAWETIDIGINQQAIDGLSTPYTMATLPEMAQLVKKRPTFSHKGLFGKGLLIAGSKGMTGAAILAGKGALRSGIGLITLKIPESSLPIVQTALPEAMAETYVTQFWEESGSVLPWSAIGVGPGIGTGEAVGKSLKALFSRNPEKLVLDADALSRLAIDPELLRLLPEDSILTPHPGEMDRLIGKKCRTGFERLESAIAFAKKHRIFLILKGAYTVTIAKDGACFFNTTGNPGMATPGSGDVLTGIIVSLLSQGYPKETACRLGVYLHGLSADYCLAEQSQESLTAGDIALHLGNAFKQLKAI